MTVLYVVRHAVTLDNETSVLTGAADDVPITSLGEIQCCELRDALRGVEFDAIFSSPLRRARQTCCCAGIEPDQAWIEPLLSEKAYGIFEGRPIAEYERAVAGMSSTDLFSFIPPGGESFRQLQDRAHAFIAKVRNETWQRVAVFSHAAFNRSLIATVRGTPFGSWLEISQDNASVTKVVL